MMTLRPKLLRPELCKITFKSGQISHPEKLEATAVRYFNLTVDNGGSIAIVDILGSGKFKFAIAAFRHYSIFSSLTLALVHTCGCVLAKLDRYLSPV